MSEAESTGVRIKVHLLRAKLEMGPDEAENPLSLGRLMGLLIELTSHVVAMERFVVPIWSAWRQFSRSSSVQAPPAESLQLLREIRGAIVESAPSRLRVALGRQEDAAQLCLLLQSAVKVASAHFAKELAAEFDPGAFAAGVRVRQPNARAEDFWRHYEQEADRMTASEIERRLTRQIVTAVEELFCVSTPAET